MDLPGNDIRAYIQDNGKEMWIAHNNHNISKDEKLLVYNYLCNGSLSSNLHGNRINKAELFSWETRSAIAISSARAVAYIHSTSPTAAHGNIKSSNILLTGDNEARLSEHGIITLYNIQNSDFGYLTVPEVKGVQTISQKADVYSFGILLLELLTGKPPTSISTSEDPDLIDWIMSVPQEQWTVEVLDLTVSMNNSVVEEMLQFLQLAIHCCEQSPNLRPEMSEVAQRIEQMRGSTIVRNNWSTSDSEEQYLNEEDIFYDAI
ncbi:hypothetical protein QOZ80_6AG0546320 [Eleusine coracana subsp. coracana]|nr:hypothetical protein QOZ80_6AG0546320 [Eleusine coracana subsp. coracana]